MTTTLQNLGTMIRSFRVEAGLTQRELAGNISPTTSRTSIALAELGQRLPSPRVLTAICTYLRIPSSVWAPFVTRAHRDLLADRNIQTQNLPQLIAIAGTNGSGKTTLLLSLSELLGYARLPEAAPGIGYLGDLAQDSRRWAFEAQLAFLTHKAIQLQTYLDRGSRVMIDRSISEDVEIFAEYWRSRGDISDRAYDTYKVLAEHFANTLPSPDLILYCRCSLETSIERVAKRHRGDELHSRDHLRDLYERYESWIQSYQSSAVAIVDTDVHDIRDPQVVRTLARDIHAVYGRRNQTVRQLALFGADKEFSSLVHQPLILRSRISSDAPANEIELAKLHATTPLLAYLAAPFTSIAGAHEPRDHEPVLFPPDTHHGVIGPGPYRRALLAIERRLKVYGIATWIPHRDTNRWGKRVMTPSEVATECTDQVAASDMVIAILGSSAGAHYEVGLARGLGKPLVLISCTDLRASYIADGLGRTDFADTLCLHADSLRDAASKLGQHAFREFLVRYFSIRAKVEEP